MIAASEFLRNLAPLSLLHLYKLSINQSAELRRRMNALNYTILHADGHKTLGQIRNFPTEPAAAFEAVRRLVAAAMGEDAHFEPVSVLHHGENTEMLVDETGRVKRLRRNEAATAIYRAGRLERQKPPFPAESLSWIAGDAVLLSKRVSR
jgi:hypothetical protein